MDREVVIKSENVTKKFGDRIVLNGVSLEVYRGETFVIMGGSGCGKSTFLRHLIGALKPDSGRISLLGRDLSVLSDDELDAVKKKIGMSFQSSALFDSMNIGEKEILRLRSGRKVVAEELTGRDACPTRNDQRS